LYNSGSIFSVKLLRNYVKRAGLCADMFTRCNL